MDAFATADDLALRMRRTFSPGETAWVTALLEDAAALMRGVMRNQVYPPAQSTYVAYPTGGWVRLPQDFVNSVDSVQRDGTDVEFVLRQDSIGVDCDEPVTIEFSYGLTVAPADLVGINCALVSGVMLTAEAGVGLTAGGLSSIAIDDFKASFADGGAASGMVLSEHSRDYLVSHYGRSAWVVEASR